MGMNLLNLGIFASSVPFGGLDENIKLMIHGNDGDSSGQAHNISYIGTAQIDATTKKFGYGSVSFDGNSDYLTIPDSADWDIVASALNDRTIDFWIKLDVLDTNQGFITHYQSDGNDWKFEITGSNVLYFHLVTGTSDTIALLGGTITDNDWHHLAMCKVASLYGIYLDGVQTAYISDASTGNWSGSLFIGRILNNVGTSKYLNGNMDGLRIQHSNYFEAEPNATPDDTITIPTSAPIADGDTKLLLNFEEGDNYGGHDVEPQGTAHIDKTVKKFGNGAWTFDGNSDYLTIPDSADFYFGTGNFTVDFWVRFDDLTNRQKLIGQYEDTNNKWHIHKSSNVDNNTLQIFFYAGSATKGLYTMTNPWAGVATNTFYHLAFVRNGAVALIFIDGVSQALTESTAFGSNDVVNLVAPLIIGQQNSTDWFDGYMDEIRVSKGIARWTENFTPPTREYF